jgi:hypothetical protein
MAKERLDVDGSLPDADFQRLRDYFCNWLAERDQDPDEGPAVNFRYCDVLVVDADAMASILEAAEEPPAIKVPSDLEERRAIVSMRGGAWMWLLDTVTIGRGDERAWMKTHLYSLPGLFKYRLLVNCDESSLICEERPAGSGEWWFGA